MNEERTLNKTSTPPLHSPEYDRGVEDVIKELESFVIPHQDAQRGITWRVDAPMLFAQKIRERLLPRTL